MGKRKPTHVPAAFKEVCSDPDRLNITIPASRTANALGFTRVEIAKTIQTMKRTHFYKSMTSYADHRNWQDVYHVPPSVGTLYIKFAADVVTEFIVLSFKEK